MNVSEYLNGLPVDRKRALSKVRALIKKRLPQGYVETTQYGMIAYVVPLTTFPEGYLGKQDVPLPYIALASQKRHMAVYLMGLYGDPKLATWFTAAWKASGKRLDMGKSCLRFAAIDDLALDVLGDAVAKLAVADYVALYAATRSKPKKPATRPKPKARPPRG